MAIEINLSQAPSYTITITGTIPAAIAADNVVNKSIQLQRSVMTGLYEAKKLHPKYPSLATEIDAIVNGANLALNAIQDEDNDSAAVIATVTDAIAQLSVSVEDAGKVKDVKDAEAEINAEAEARKVAIDRERDAKLASVAAVVK